MFVRAERLYGDDLAEVHLVEVDSRTVDELQSFVETGQCTLSLFAILRGMAPRITPIVPVEDALLDRELRECICAAYLIEFGHPIEIVAKFRQQLK
jgi:hypothetical protein